jgi:chorismate mutase
MPKMFVPVVRQTVMNANADLQTVRRAIDGIDEALADLLACRICLSHHAQEMKAKAGLPVRDPAREGEICYRYDLRWRGSSAVAQAILRWCRDE